MRYLWYLLLICTVAATYNHRGELFSLLPERYRKSVPHEIASAFQSTQTKKLTQNRPQLRILYNVTPAPTFVLRSLDGSKILDRSTLVGQTTVITFFAGWCGVCKASMPVDMQLRQQYPHTRFVGVIYKDTPINAMMMLRTHGNPFETIFVDTGGSAAKSFGVKGVPDSYIIDRSGNIRFSFGGIIDPNELLQGGGYYDIFQQLLT